MTDGEKNFLSEFELNKLLAAAGKPCLLYTSDAADE